MDCSDQALVFLYSKINPRCAFLFSGYEPLNLPGFGPYLLLFALTNLLEFPIYAIALRSLHLPYKKILQTVLLINTLTHPAVCFVFPFLAHTFHWTYSTEIIASETFAPLIESMALLLLFQEMTVGKAVAAGISANLFSWVFGGYILQF